MSRVTIFPWQGSRFIFCLLNWSTWQWQMCTLNDVQSFLSLGNLQFLCYFHCLLLVFTLFNCSNIEVWGCIMLVYLREWWVVMTVMNVINFVCLNYTYECLHWQLPCRASNNFSHIEGKDNWDHCMSKEGHIICYLKRKSISYLIVCFLRLHAVFIQYRM